MEEFEKLLAAVRNAVERYVRFRVSAAADADDVLQEVYAAAYDRFPQLKNKDVFKAWIISIARNKCVDYFRRKEIRREVLVDQVPEDNLCSGRAIAPEVGAVRETFRLLGEKDREILYLYFWAELTQAEIAKRLCIPVGTVKSRLHAAKQKFKKNYPYRTHGEKGEWTMKKLPEMMPEYTITKSAQAPFAVKWEELFGYFIIPRLGEKVTWGLYENTEKRCSEWGEWAVVGKAVVHGIEGVEIKACSHDPIQKGKDDSDHYYVAQLTDTHCRMLAENCKRDGVRRYRTFLDGDDFLAQWGYGEDNCGRETFLQARGKITEYEHEVFAENTKQDCDIVGRYTVTIGGRAYDTVKVLSFDSNGDSYVCIEQYLDANGRTILWRRYNRDDWAFGPYRGPWSERLPDSDRFTVNGETYVHWYDCITDYIL